MIILYKVLQFIVLTEYFLMGMKKLAKKTVIFLSRDLSIFKPRVKNFWFWFSIFFDLRLMKIRFFHFLEKLSRCVETASNSNSNVCAYSGQIIYNNWLQNEASIIMVDPSIIMPSYSMILMWLLIIAYIIMQF